MEKPIVNMIEWELYVYDEIFYLSGVAESHPKLGKNAYVSYTSAMQHTDFKDDVLTYETRNTIYICPLKYMTRYPYGNVAPDYQEELTHRADCSENYLDQIIAATAKIALEVDQNDEYVKHIMELQKQGEQEIKLKEEKENADLCDIAKKYEDCIYIEVSNIWKGDKLAYHLGDNVGVVLPDVHGGMYQDSVLYMKHGLKNNNACQLDFRYFPQGLGDSMETYSWSDNIKTAVIKNVGKNVLRFNGVPIQPGETKSFTSDIHQES